MPSFETLDLIADAYIPVLAIVILGFIVTASVKSQWRIAGFQLLATAVVLSITYGLMFLDLRLRLWPSLGLDYSTHTAVALVLAAALSFSAPRFALVWAGSLASYFALMLYQGYHTLADIAVTGFVVGIPAWLALRYIHNRQPRIAADKL